MRERCTARPTRRRRSCACSLGRRRFARLESLTYSRRRWPTPTPLRTLLFVPGNDRRKIDKALGLGASAVMLDLEDAVAASEKVGRARDRRARALLAAPPAGRSWACASTRSRTGLADADLDALAGALARIALITLPMVESADDDPPRRRPPRRARAGGRRRRGLGRAARDDRDRARRARRARDRRVLAAPAHAAVRAGRPRRASSAWSSTADGFEHLHARSAIVLAARARRQGGPDRRPLSQARRRRGLRGLRQPGRGASAFRARSPCTRASCRSRPPRSRRASASWPGRARSTAPSARPRPPGISSIKLADGTFVDYPVARARRATTPAVRSDR